MIYRLLIDEIKEALPEIQIIILEPFVLKGTATEKLWNEFNTEVRKLAEISKEIANEYSFEFVPLQDKFDERSAVDGASFWSVDGIHPTVNGHHLIKENLLKTFEKINLNA